jgi:hypothetical protein
MIARDDATSGCGPTCEAVVTAAAKETIRAQERANAEAYLQEKARPKRSHRQNSGEDRHRQQQTQDNAARPRVEAGQSAVA